MWGLKVEHISVPLNLSAWFYGGGLKELLVKKKKLSNT